jgi:hypothetical protein
MTREIQLEHSIEFPREPRQVIVKVYLDRAAATELTAALGAMRRTGHGRVALASQGGTLTVSYAPTLPRRPVRCWPSVDGKRSCKCRKQR